MVQRLIRRANGMAEFPQSGPLQEEFGAGIRLLVESPYVIVYRIEDAAIVIIRVLHGARDLPNLIG